MKNVAISYGSLFQERRYVQGLISGFCVLILSFIVANFAGTYATEVAGNSVNDLILNNLRVRDVTFLHVYASMLFWFIFSFYLLLRPETLPFVTKTAALFILVRSVFISLTHLGAPANNLTIPDNFTNYFLFNGDLFFSGHVGGPFLLLLMFWSNTIIRYICGSASLLFSYTVLVGHIHYSIDVFAAPFITYGIYQLSRYFFARDYDFFEKNYMDYQ